MSEDYYGYAHIKDGNTIYLTEADYKALERMYSRNVENMVILKNGDMLHSRMVYYLGRMSNRIAAQDARQATESLDAFTDPGDKIVKAPTKTTLANVPDDVKVPTPKTVIKK